MQVHVGKPVHIPSTICGEENVQGLGDVWWISHIIGMNCMCRERFVGCEPLCSVVLFIVQ